MKVIRPVKVQCKNCREEMTFNADLQVAESRERQMGTEVYFSDEIQDECPKCGNKICIEFEVWEYPIGDVECQEERCKGGCILERPTYDPSAHNEF